MVEDLRKAKCGMTLRATAVAIAIAAMGVAPRVARAAPVPAAASDTTAGKHVRVRVDVTEARSSGPVIRARVTERAGLMLLEAGVQPWRDESHATVNVRVGELTGEDPGYAFELWIERSGDDVGPHQEITCALCTETELVDRVVTTIEAAVAAMPEAGAPKPVAQEEHPNALPRSARPTDQPGPLQTKGKVGVGLLSAGGVIAAVGLGLAIAPPKPVPDNPLKQRSLRPGGYALLGIGGAAIISGAVLLALDRRNARLAVAPVAGQGTAGVLLLGRF